MNEPTTCGKGLAANSVLPATMADMIEALSTVLAIHSKALDLKDERSRQEHVAYSQLAQECADIAHLLRTAAQRMSGYRDLPMGRHDVNVMAASGPVEAFERFVNREQELLALLRARLPIDQNMLDDMREAGRRQNTSG